MIAVVCPRCAAELEFPQELAGRPERCPHCKAHILIPVQKSLPDEVCRKVADAADQQSKGGEPRHAVSNNPDARGRISSIIVCTLAHVLMIILTLFGLLLVLLAACAGHTVEAILGVLIVVSFLVMDALSGIQDYARQITILLRVLCELAESRKPGPG